MTRTLRSGERGAALVELALTLPLLAVLLVGTIDLGRVFYTSMALTNAARAGAQYGSGSLAKSGDISTMQSIATNSITISGVTATASRLCQCANDTGTFSSTSPSANNCTSVVTTSCPGSLHRVVTVTVTATKSYATPSLLGLPTLALSRTSTLRVSE